MNPSEKHTNALVRESSPYLLQHAHNPVDWHPWGEEAFEKAKEENKLVLVSIGYSACHWCHVMERETFENEEAAEMMNRHFVCVKVDREEHPEVDQVYMSAVQLMTQSGGWPLNCFALPDGRPVYGGTYFPREQWMHVMDALMKLKSEDPEKMEKYAQKLQKGVAQIDLVEKVEKEESFDSSKLKELVLKWSSQWDRGKGGPNRAPKFPMPNNYQFLLDYGFYTSEDEVLDYVKTSLNKMCRGGIYDQIGGGFARYSVDAEWKVPHFERMLYDNAQLVSVYSNAFQLTGEAEYERVVRETLAFVEREMTDQSGLFYSGLDADSEGVEGKFYTWKKEDLERILGEDFSFAREYFGVDANGYWEVDVYILLRPIADTAFAEKRNISVEQLYEKVDKIKEVLLKEREKRIRPGLDNKMLTSWNALMISGLVAASKAFHESSYRDKALKAAEEIWSNRYSDGELIRSFKAGDRPIAGSLEDYSFTIEAFLDVYEITFDEQWLDRARELLEKSIERFRDAENGMFWFSQDHSKLLFAKSQEVMDNVIPATNSSIAKGLFRLGHFLSEEKYLDLSREMLANILPVMSHGSAFSNWAQLLFWWSQPFFEVAVTGPECEDLRDKINEHFLPGKILLGSKRSSDLPLLQGKFREEGTIYVCVNKTCKSPVSGVEEAVEQMKR